MSDVRKSCLASLAPILVVGFCVGLAAGTCAEDVRPGLVTILAADQSHRDFGFMGSDPVHTRHIGGPAARSARDLNGYVPMIVCRPSLATPLTRLYPLPLDSLHVTADPRESRNLAAGHDHAGRPKNMRRSLDEWWCGNDDAVTQRGDQP